MDGTLPGGFGDPVIDTDSRPFTSAVIENRRHAERRNLNVALVSMPFGSVQTPNIQIGLLKAILLSRGFRAETLHLNLEFAVRIGGNVFEQLATFRGPLFGDWLFGKEAFEDDPDPDVRLPGLYPDLARVMFEGREDAADLLKTLRAREVGDFLDAMVEDVPWTDYDVVGFTSTFQQTVASIALARRLKDRFPGIVTVFGGANFDGEMGEELVRRTPAIDYAVAGEADLTFPALLDELLRGRRAPATPGVLYRSDGEVAAPPRAALFTGLDDNPAPDYSEYFERMERLDLLSDPARRLVDLPFESSRGCWWGQKHHCTFCGLNGQTMGYRSKSIGHVVDELAGMARRYRSFRFIAVDNIINHTFLGDIAGRLNERLVGADLFYEIKANLSNRQIEDLGRAGITRIQPGIESLSTPVLKLMRKGITAIQNVNTLKWAHFHGLRVSWNVLWGFPGEAAQDYADQADLVPKLAHIPPPSTWGRIWLERFSPLFFETDNFGRRDVRPHGSYQFVFPPSFDLTKVAYFFEAKLDGTLGDEAYAPLEVQLEAWLARWKDDERPTLRYWWAPGELIIEDSRALGKPGSYVFEGSLADSYHRMSDKPRSLPELSGSVGCPEDRLRSELGELCDAGLAMREGDTYLALALPARPSLGQSDVR